MNLIEASPNLITKQQDKMLKELQERLNMFLIYDLDLHEKSKNPENNMTIERFLNRDQNFSISWYPSLKSYYNMYLEDQI